MHPDSTAINERAEEEQKQLIIEVMKAFVKESPLNWSDVLQGPYYDEPIIQFASADDPLFEEYKSIIGPGHATPKEVIERSFGSGTYNGGSVISIVLPIHESIRKANRQQKERASREWALLRTFGDEYFLKAARLYLTDYLKNLAALRLRRWIRIGTGSPVQKQAQSPIGQNVMLLMLPGWAPSVLMMDSFRRRELPYGCCR